ncbi:hypothetical protein J3Q64DRAFT_1820543 [Phycomyces blakesleeanus]|uniref:Peptidase S54 rhomboid domain-containing protein n=1 Tax=Phycomyces blakesleeanus TaxID=4837 RepID=A0ABR3B3J1_PHYBL
MSLIFRLTHMYHIFLNLFLCINYVNRLLKSWPQEEYNSYNWRRNQLKGARIIIKLRFSHNIRTILALDDNTLDFQSKELYPIGGFTNSGCLTVGCISSLSTVQLTNTVKYY